MGDLNHLEKMGGELKCPICLSLLNSAISLNCNHVFCNSCILETMKSGYNCPVCKVPYRRREVRPAPHMDNLVSIYKSMEIASGVNIFVTQNATSTKLSDGEQHLEGCDKKAWKDSIGIFQDGTNKRKNGRRKASIKAFNSDVKNAAWVHVKPSFPTKKRIQVPHSSLSGPARQHDKFGGENETTNVLPCESKKVSKNKPALDENGEPALSPFFWLRDEENIESQSQCIEEDQLIDVPPSNVPCFSDIRDSDDEILNSQGDMHGKAFNVADTFDSEMFEWTQRACSPELCSSSFNMQVISTDESRGKLEKELKVSLHDNRADKMPFKDVTCMNLNQDNGSTDELPVTPSSGPNNAGEGSSHSRKKPFKERRTAKKTSAMEHTYIFSGNNLATDKGHYDESFNFSAACKRRKKVGLRFAVTNPSPENTLTVLPRSETLNISDKNATSLGDKVGNKSDLTLNGGKICKALEQNHTKHQTKSRKRKLGSGGYVLEEESNMQNQILEDGTHQLSLLSVPVVHCDKTGDHRNESIKIHKKPKPCDPELSKKKSRVSDGNKKDANIQNSQDSRGKDIEAKEIYAKGIKPHNADARVLDDQLRTRNNPSAINGSVLRRCKATLSKVQCAFCLSSEVSEASGEIVHFCNGRAVSADHSGASKIIHAHRNCTEWAPNVYFKDDIAINLESELQRSRRIRCSLCGIKGASLGCFEKCCRKSFHITCAKSIHQCRWDFVNFVMLCPLHPSSKLPMECSEFQGRKICYTKKKSSLENNKVSGKNDLGTSAFWNAHGSSKKLALCCSALTNLERDYISEFEKISGVTVLKKWDSCVTHVIASTDETGACRRTLKVLMGILEGRWILNMKWVKACMEAMQLVDEEPYEITVDIHGIKDGPRLGRLRILNKQPKLFSGLKFYFMGEFVQSYKAYLHDLVTVAGGTILHRKPVSDGQQASSSSSRCQTFIIYSLELPDQCDSIKEAILNCRQSDAMTLASLTGTKAVNNLWVLNSIAGSKLQCLSE